jgi:hypothetical protein
VQHFLYRALDDPYFLFSIPMTFHGVNPNALAVNNSTFIVATDMWQRTGRSGCI